MKWDTSVSSFTVLDYFLIQFCLSSDWQSHLIQKEMLKLSKYILLHVLLYASKYKIINIKK